MKGTIFFLVALCAIATATTAQEKFLPLAPPKYSALNDLLAQVAEQSHLGKALNGYIHLKMKMSSGNPDFSKLFGAFDQIIAFLKQTKINEDASMAVRNTSHGSLTTAYTNTIDTESINMDNANEAITDLTNSIADGKNGVVRLDSVLETNIKTQKDTHTLRLAQQTTFDETVPKIQLAIKGCQEAHALLKELVSGTTALIEIKDKQENTVASIRKSTQALFQVSGMNKQHRMLAALIEIMQDFTDQSSLGQVLELISNLEVELITKLESIRNTNAAQITQFDLDVVALKTEETNLGTSIGTLRTNITTDTSKSPPTSKYLLASFTRDP